MINKYLLVTNIVAYKSFLLRGSSFKEEIIV